MFKECGFLTHILEIESLPSSMRMGRVGICEGLKEKKIYIYGCD